MDADAVRKARLSQQANKRRQRNSMTSGGMIHKTDAPGKRSSRHSVLPAEKENTQESSDILPFNDEAESSYIEVGVGEIDLPAEQRQKGSNRLQRMLKEEGVNDHYTPSKPTRFASEAHYDDDHVVSPGGYSDRSSPDSRGRSPDDEYDRLAAAVTEAKSGKKERRRKSSSARHDEPRESRRSAAPESSARESSAREQQQQRPLAAEGGTSAGKNRRESAPRAPVPGQHTAAAASDNPLFFDDLYDFVSQPAPEGVSVKCEIVRDKGSVEKGMYPMYYLKLEPREGETKKVFLLAGRKRKRSRNSNYIMSIDATDLSRDGEAFVAKLRSNFYGTSFTIYDNGVNPDKMNKSENKGKNVRCELASVLYETNILGFKGPRKMTCLMPGMDQQQKPFKVQPKVDRDTIVKRHGAGRMTDLIALKNKSPSWNEETLSYVLNFKGRVTQASVKNFQIVHEEDPDYVVLQFGRVSEHVFTMDYQYPMTAIQAFGICLSSFDGKLACE